MTTVSSETAASHEVVGDGRTGVSAMGSAMVSEPTASHEAVGNGQEEVTYSIGRSLVPDLAATYITAADDGRATLVDRACPPSELAVAFLAVGDKWTVSREPASHEAGDRDPSMTSCESASHEADEPESSLGIQRLRDEMIEELGDDLFACVHRTWLWFVTGL